MLNNGAVLNNLANGEIRFTGPDNALRTTAGVGTLNNAGLLASGGQNIEINVTAANFLGGSTVNAGSKIAYLYAGSDNYSGSLTLTGDVRLNSGAHNFADGTVVNGSGTLSQVGGSTVMNNVTMNKAYALGSGNTLTIAPTKTFTVNGGLSIDANGADTAIVGGGTLVIPNSATTTITGGGNNDFYIDNVTVNNAGLINLNQPSASHVSVLNNGAVLNNLASGEIRFTGLDNRLLTTAGSGTVNNAGLLSSGGQDISINVTTANFLNGSTVNAGSKIAYLYAGSDNYSGNVSFTGNNVVMSSGSHTVNGAITANAGTTFTVAGGVVNLADGSMLNLADNLVFSGGAINLVGTGTGTTLSAGSTLSLSGKAIGGSGVLTNQGTLNFTNSTLAGSLTNQGTLNVGPGTSSVDGALLDLQSGSVNIAGGATLGKNSGVMNWAGGALNGPGNLVTAGGASVEFNGSGSRVLNNLGLNAGALNLSAGSLDVQSGSLLINGGNVAGGATLAVSGGTLGNSGLLQVQGTLALSGGSVTGAGTVGLTGVLDKTGSGTVALANTLNNSGAVQVNGGTLSLTGGGTHSGTFAAAATGTVDFQGGNHNFADGAVFSGPGSFDGGGILNITGTGVGLQFNAGTSINLNALAFGGSGNITNLGTVNGTGLTLPGSFVNGAGAAANFSNVTIAGNLFNSGDFNVGGTVTIAGTQAQQLGGVLTIPAGATLDMSNPSGQFSWQDGTIGGLGTLGFSGGGTFLFAGAGDRVIDGLNFAFNNLILPDGSLTLQSGSLTLTGTTVLPAGVALNLYGGTLTNNGTLDVAGAFSLTGGAFAGSGSLTMSGGSLSLPAGNAVAWTNSGVLTNTGTLDLADSTITNAIDNLGTINLGSGLSFTQAVTNTGTISAQAGTSVFTGGLDQNAGGNIVLNGGNLQGNVNLNAGSISGSGTVNGNVVIGNATLAPGFSPGSIVINGNLNLGPGSVLNIEIGGLVQGSGYDWIKVNGTANLAGTLNVNNFGGFVAAPGSQFTFINFNASSGSFAVVNLPLAPNFLLASAFNGLTISVPAPSIPASSVLGGDSISVAIERLFNNDEVAATLAMIVPVARGEDQREIEVEGCR